MDTAVDRAAAARLLADSSTFGTVGHILAYAAQGDELYESDIAETMAAMSDKFGALPSDELSERLQAILLATQTSAFYHDPKAFRAVANALVEGDADFEAFDELTAIEILWADYEVGLNHEGGQYAPEVELLIGTELASEVPTPEESRRVAVEHALPYFETALNELRDELGRQLAELGLDPAELPPLGQ